MTLNTLGERGRLVRASDIAVDALGCPGRAPLPRARHLPLAGQDLRDLRGPTPALPTGSNANELNLLGADVGEEFGSN